VLAFIWCSDGFKNLEHQIKLKSPHFFVFVHLCLGLGRKKLKYYEKTALFLFMLFAFVMKAQEKIFLGKAEGKGIKYYIYPKTVKESSRPGYITAWILKEYSIPQKSSNGKYHTKSNVQLLINCKYGKSGLISSISYSKNGDVVYRGNVDEYLVQLSSPSPESIGEDMMKSACRIYDVMFN